MLFGIVIAAQVALAFTCVHGFYGKAFNRTEFHTSRKTQVACTAFTNGFIDQGNGVVVKVYRTFYIGAVLVVYGLGRVLNASVAVNVRIERRGGSPLVGNHGYIGDKLVVKHPVGNLHTAAQVSGSGCLKSTFAIFVGNVCQYAGLTRTASQCDVMYVGNTCSAYFVQPVNRGSVILIVCPGK